MSVHQAHWSHKDPSNPSDMLGVSIAEGDFVSWPISIGRSVGMSVGVIDAILFKHKNPAYPMERKEWIDGPQQGADHYTLRLEPVITTGYYTKPTVYVPEGYVDEDGRKRHFRPTGKRRLVRLAHVGKVLKLDSAAVLEALGKHHAAN